MADLGLHRPLSTAALAAALGWLPGTGQAQLADIFKAVVPSILGASAPGAARPATADRADVARAAPVKGNPAVAGELSPDVNCERPAEKFNLSEKLLQYGGTAAALRLQRLVTTDFAYSDLTPEDKAMLEYLAHTTVWLPVEAEAKLGSLYDTASGFGVFKRSSLSDEELLAQAEVQKKLDEVRQQVPDYPSDIRLTVDKALSDGAFARFGGVIQLSSRFLNGLEDAGVGAHFLLAHEMSHIYKRHAIKNLQFKLISSSEGWQLVRQLLQRAQRGMEIDPIADGVFLFRVVPALIEFIRGTQIKFVVNQELEADACSVVWLQRLNADPVSAWRTYHAKLGAQTAYSEEHPSTTAREARFAQRASKGDGDGDTGKGNADKGQQTSPDKGTVKRQGGKIIKDSAKTR